MRDQTVAEPSATRAPFAAVAVFVLLLVSFAALPAVALAGPAGKRPAPADIVAQAVRTQMLEHFLPWPDSAGDSVTLDAATIRSAFDMTNYPDPPAESAPFVSARVYDDLDPVSYTTTWDSNGNGRLILEWRAASAGAVRRYSMVVQFVTTTCPCAIPQGLALYSGGSLISNGGGTNPKISVEVAPVVGTATVRVAGTVDDPNVVAAGMSLVTGSAAGRFDDFVTPTWLAMETEVAEATGRYFTSTGAALASPVNATWSPQGGISGLCVLDLPGGTTLSLPSGTWNSQASPGLLLVLCGDGTATLQVVGNGDYYGVACVEGALTGGHGTMSLHGSCLASGSADLRNTPNILYNDNVLRRATPNLMRAEAVPLEQTLTRLE